METQNQTENVPYKTYTIPESLIPNRLEQTREEYESELKKYGELRMTVARDEKIERATLLAFADFVKFLNENPLNTHKIKFNVDKTTSKWSPIISSIRDNDKSNPLLEKLLAVAVELISSNTITGLSDVMPLFIRALFNNVRNVHFVPITCEVIHPLTLEKAYLTTTGEVITGRNVPIAQIFGTDFETFINTHYYDSIKIEQPQIIWDYPYGG